MSCMSAIYIFGKTAKCDQKSFFAHFQILMEMGSAICLQRFWHLTFDEIHYLSVYFWDFCDLLNILKQFINKI